MQNIVLTQEALHKYQSYKHFLHQYDMMFCVTNLLAARIRERAIFNQNSQELGGERAIFTFNIILISSALPPPQAACHDVL